MQSLTVPLGTTVRWTNRDPAPHTSTSGTVSQKSNVWDSGTIGAGGSFSFTFTEPGTFQYFCEIHPFMTGTVVVTE